MIAIPQTPTVAPPPCWRVEDALCWAMKRLAHTSEAALSAKLLLAHALGCTITDLFVHPERGLTASEQATYHEWVARRAQHEPVAYIIGHRQFLDLDFRVDRRVLIPRPETELLVERAISVASRWTRPRLVDVGTGSGAVAVSLAARLPQATIVAIDSSAGALHVARQNARLHGVEDRIVLLQGDLLTPLRSPVEHELVSQQVEIVVANLPYVSEDEYVDLPPSTRLYEPSQALVAGTDGLDAIRGLLSTARPYLSRDGVILLEIGAGQGSAVSFLATQCFPNAQVEVHPDFARHDRIVSIELEP